MDCLVSENQYSVDLHTQEKCNKVAHIKHNSVPGFPGFPLGFLKILDFLVPLTPTVVDFSLFDYDKYYYYIN